MPLFLLISTLGLSGSAVPLAAAEPSAREVETLLIKRCSECHGPDQQKGKLRLDSRSTALQAGKSGRAAVVPGKPAESELIARITSTDPDEFMPPKGARLTGEEVALLRHWIETGAVWPEVDPRQHWAFTKPVRPEVPRASDLHAGWVRNEIDHFVLARLEREGLEPQNEADRYTLARRVSLDLTGLPLGWERVEAFVRDRSPDAYAKLVDELLASPQYGEHMARGWLDLARYADSNGYQVDLARSIWPYRDWVIRAFNENMPFDQFTIEQLAGDLLPNATLEQKVATGFNRNTKINDEGGGDAEEYRVKAVKDRLATVGTTWLGLTLMCAECHSHKYDPVSQDDYYRLYAFFNNTTDGGNYSVAPTVEVPAARVSRTNQYLAERLAATRQALSTAELALPKAQASWEKQVARRESPWRVLSLTNAASTGGASYTNLPDGSLLATGVNPIYDTITVEADADLTGVTAVMLELLPDASLPNKGPGRWSKTGNFILDEFAMTARPVGAGETGRPVSANTNVVFSAAVADWEQQYYRAEHAVDGNPKTGWAIGPRFGQPHFLIADLARPGAFSGRKRVGFRFDHYHGNSHCVGRFRLSVATEKDPIARWPVPEAVRAAARIAADRRTPEQRQLLAAHYRTVSPDVRRLEREVFRLEERIKEEAARKASTLIVQERTEAKPRATYVHVRGNFLEKGSEVGPGVPAVFPPLPEGPVTNRLSLARWLMLPDNPLPARVTVNNFWQRYFGTGLVKTSEDFGRQGEAPSHPELLDWLATEFVRSGWDVKALQRRLVLSATYRQSAVADARRLEKDYYNRLLSRGPRFRLDGEMIRDQALCVSGLLNPQIGGPSVYPVQVANLWKEIGFLRPEIGMDEWPVSEGPDLYRRGLYTFWRRVCTYPVFATFDAPSREVCTARRPRTNTPLQALAGLNEPTLLEAARVFAQRILAEGGSSVDERVEFAFRTSLGRRPNEAETERLRAFVEQQLKSYRRDRPSAQRLISVGAAPLPTEIDARELAAWMMLANLLLNLDETLTKG